MNGGSYRVEIAPRAERELHSLSADVRRRIIREIDALGRDPRPRGAQKLSGSDDVYRIRKGDYRVLYQIRDQALLILVLVVGHRRDVYRRRP